MSATWRRSEPSGTPSRKLRFACNSCHHAKTKCSGGSPCTGCLRSGEQCVYSQSNRVGRPKGTKNKRTLDLQANGNSESSNCSSSNNSSSSSNGSDSNNNNNNSSGGGNGTDSKTNSSSSITNTTNPTHHSTYTTDDTMRPLSHNRYSPQIQHQQTSQQEAITSTNFDFGLNDDFPVYPNISLDSAIGDMDFSFAFANCDPSTNFMYFEPSTDMEYDGTKAGPRISLSPKTSTIPRSGFFQQSRLVGNGFSELEQGMYLSSGCGSGNGSARKRAFPSDHLAGTFPLTSVPFPGEPDATNDTTSSDTLSGQSGESTDCSTSPLPTSSSAPSDSSTCECLQHHMKLLVQVNDLGKRSTPAPIDIVLNTAQRALTPLNYYIQCHVCQHEEDEEVLILSTMSIRAVLRLLQKACSDSTSKSGVWNRDAPMRSIRRRLEAPTGLTFNVGSYEVTGEERMLVLEFLLSKTMSKIQDVLGCLKERCSKKRTMRPLIGPHGTHMDENNGNANGDHVQKLLQGIESTAQILSNTLTSGHFY